jgi:hypothetical protein
MTARLILALTLLALLGAILLAGVDHHQVNERYNFGGRQ